MWEMRKFMARSSQFMKSSTISLIAGSITCKLSTLNLILLNSKLCFKKIMLKV